MMIAPLCDANLGIDGPSRHLLSSTSSKRSTIALGYRLMQPGKAERVVAQHFPVACQYPAPPSYPISICRIAFRGAVTASLLRLPLQIVCEPAQLVRNVRCTQSEITQGLSRFVEKRSQIFLHGPGQTRGAGI